MLLLPIPFIFLHHYIPSPACLLLVLGRNNVQERLQIEPWIIGIPYNCTKLLVKPMLYFHDHIWFFITWKTLLLVLISARTLKGKVSLTYYLHPLSLNFEAGSSLYILPSPAESNFAYAHILDRLRLISPLLIVLLCGKCRRRYRRPAQSSGGPKRSKY